MALANCAKCGGEVRLGAQRISVERRRGVAHYIVHLGKGCGSDDGYACAMVKPYPKRDEEKPWFQMIERWNAEQAK